MCVVCVCVFLQIFRKMEFLVRRKKGTKDLKHETIIIDVEEVYDKI
jgi:hypothetical protein